MLRQTLVWPFVLFLLPLPLWSEHSPQVEALEETAVESTTPVKTEAPKKTKAVPKAESPAEAKPSTEAVPSVMYQLLGHIIKLQPYMVSEGAFGFRRNEKFILSHLKSLVQISEHLHQSERLKTPGFSVSGRILQEHLKFTLKSFRMGKKRYARRLLNAALDGCSSCHTQVSRRGAPRWVFQLDQLKGSDLEKAHFLFATRQYDAADGLYSKALAREKRSKVKETILKRKLAINVRIRGNLKMATQALQEAFRSRGMRRDLKLKIKAWLSQIKELENLPEMDPKKASAQNVQDFAARALGPMDKLRDYDADSFAKYLFISGVIFEFLNSHGQNSTTPALLYWLAVCEHGLSKQYYYSLQEVYLEQCIRLYPGHPVAKNCYYELERQTLLSFTGSAGMQLPPDVEERFQVLKELAEGN